MEKLRLYIFAFISMGCWASTFVWFKVANASFSPLTIVLFRLIIASIILETYCRLFKKNQKIKKEDYKIFLLLAFCEPFCYFLGESFGLQYISATMGSLIISTIPLFTPVLAITLLKEKIKIQEIIGLFVSFFGILLIVLKDTNITGSFKGILLEFFAVCAGVGYSVVAKKLTHKYNSFMIVKIQSMIAAIYFLPLFLIFDFNNFSQSTHLLSDYSSILKLSIFGSVIAFILFTELVKGLGPIVADLFTNLIPIFTMIIAYIVIDEKITGIKLIGTFIVVLGISVSQLKFSKKRSVCKI